ncbi:PPOX class F420-dependent oxidoreductase [Streptacidiphilus sp. N1-12]|uniref:PPOX class F420-dependent oxidoreductase n=2 Tax=Streptacidiphilus alkalitolerans TaxID=3342712 RepID=A0ABV6WE19_9ACTN
MATPMTETEWRAFLSEGTRTGKLATTRADGRPHVAPIWFLLDGDDIVFNTAATTVKGRTLARDGRAALCVDDDRPPFSFALVEGTATLSDDLDQVRHWATRIAARYMGEERAEEYGARNGVPGELVVRLRIGKVVAFSSLSD